MTTHSQKLIPLVCIPAWRCLASTLAAALGADTPLLTDGGDGEDQGLSCQISPFSLAHFAMFMRWLMMERRLAAAPTCCLITQDPRDVPRS